MMNFARLHRMVVRVDNSRLGVRPGLRAATEHPQITDVAADEDVRTPTEQTHVLTETSVAAMQRRFLFFAQRKS